METNRAEKTLRLFTPAGHALTELTSCDTSVSLPTEIRVDHDGKATALHADFGDVQYQSLENLCKAYGLNVSAVRTELNDPDTTEYVDGV